MVKGDFVNIILNDGHYIYSHDMIDEHLESLGFDLSDLESHFCGDDDTPESTGDDWELIADEYGNALRSMYNEIDELITLLAAGKGGTKKVMAEKIRKVMDYYVS